jgi:hypothetical protein
MDITLDDERWQLPDDTSLMEALAQINDKAEQKGRLVTSLRIAGKPVTDRDLHPSFLAQQGSEAATIEATSRSFRSIMSDAAGTVRLFSAQLKRDGEALIAPLRAGRTGFAAVDAWLGRLADYVEIEDAGRAQGLSDGDRTRAVSWVQELVDARHAADAVRLADILEYEFLPTLTDGGGER